MGSAVGVIGGSGYAGGELLRLLAAHPSFEVVVVQGHSSAGRLIADVHPQLRSLSSVAITPLDAEEVTSTDLVFLALPHGRSAAIARQLPADAVVIDLGADHRLKDPQAWDRYYGGPHADAWTYGLPELPGARAQIGTSLRVANPGCYATAALLALAPLARTGLVDLADVVVVAASGSSGAGRVPSEQLLASEVMGSVAPYKVGGRHQHTPEMQQGLQSVSGTPATVSFTPILAPMPRGILATVTCKVTGDAGAAEAAVAEAFDAAYGNEPFVHVLPHGKLPRTADVVGSNSAQLQAVVDPASRRVTVVSAIDNLGKGAAGQAVQNANIVLGLDEGAGLAIDGVAP